MPGYAVVGDVAEVGPEAREVQVGERVGALTMVGGYAEHVRVPARRLVTVPSDVDPVEAAPVLINYLVAYQVMHRAGRVPDGGSVVVIGASGGIGTAFLQLGQLAGLTTYGLASARKHDVLRAYDAVPIDYRTEDFATVVGRAEPDGVDAIFDGMGGSYVARGLPLLKRGGRHVVYGPPGPPWCAPWIAVRRRARPSPTPMSCALHADPPHLRARRMTPPGSEGWSQGAPQRRWRFARLTTPPHPRR